MAEKQSEAPAASQSLDDRELDLRSIVIFGLTLFFGTLIVVALMWWMSTAFKTLEEAKDRPPSPIGEARLDPIPPGPRLQSVPPRDMDQLRTQDRKALTEYGWVDQANGVAHIPVDRAIAILAEKGLPPTPPGAATAPGGTVPAETTPGEAAPSSAPPKPPKAAHRKKEPK
jgi:hypothetical protein